MLIKFSTQQIYYTVMSWWQWALGGKNWTVTKHQYQLACDVPKLNLQYHCTHTLPINFLCNCLLALIFIYCRYRSVVDRIINSKQTALHIKFGYCLIYIMLKKMFGIKPVILHFLIWFFLTIRINSYLYFRKSWIYIRPVPTTNQN